MSIGSLKLELFFISICSIIIFYQKDTKSSFFDLFLKHNLGIDWILYNRVNRWSSCIRACIKMANFVRRCSGLVFFSFSFISFKILRILAKDKDKKSSLDSKLQFQSICFVGIFRLSDTNLIFRRRAGTCCFWLIPA